MSIQHTNRGNTLGWQRMAAVIVLLCLCFQLGFVPTARAEGTEGTAAEAYNGMTLKERKDARVLRERWTACIRFPPRSFRNSRTCLMFR